MFHRPAPLTEHHRLDSFDSGKPSLDSYLQQMALFNQREGHARTFVIANTDQRVVGYHSLCAGMISRNAAPKSVAGHGSPKDIPVALLRAWQSTRIFAGEGWARLC